MKLWITLTWMSIKVFGLTASQFDDPNYSNLVRVDLKLLPDETQGQVEQMEILSTRIGEVTDTVYLYGQAKINSTWSTVLHANTTLVLQVQPSKYGFEVDDRNKVTYFTNGKEDETFRIYKIDAQKQVVAEAKEFPQLSPTVNSKPLLISERNIVFMMNFKDGMKGVCMFDTSNLAHTPN